MPCLWGHEPAHPLSHLCLAAVLAAIVPRLTVDAKASANRSLVTMVTMHSVARRERPLQARHDRLQILHQQVVLDRRLCVGGEPLAVLGVSRQAGYA